MSEIRHLIDYFIPENYQLHLNISRGKRQFNGTVTMTGQPLKKQVRMHVKNLDISQVLADGDEVDWSTEDDEIIVKRQAEQITVAFTGKLSDTAMNGLYLSKYKVDNQEKELFATQFESHYARECFPCIDEPAAKATFDISITTDDPDDKVVLSNMPGHRSGNTWRFATTPRMSTYLVAFVGGDLISKSTATNGGVDINVYATTAQPASLLDHALNIARRSVEFYEDYFGIPYPLPKLDNVALPDFSAGAMENWGLITYREVALLADDNSAEDSREYIATVVAHEIAHQWFGNLVTMQWWNDLWLNESFASLMENTAVDHVHPEYNVWEDFETSDVPAAMKRDALAGVQSVRQDVNSPDEIATLFDGAIVYAKGERLLKMLRAYIGEETFRRGLTQYFQKYQYQNTIANDLWQCLSDASGLDIQSLMATWLTKPGYPIIHAHRNGNQLILRQEQFRNFDEPASTQLWSIPLFSNIPDAPKLMGTAELTIDLPAMDEPIQLNVGNNTHCIVKYDDQLLSDLSNHFTQLSTTDKIKLLRESLLLSNLGWQDISQSFSLLRNAHGEDNQAVLTMLASVISSLNSLTEPKSSERQQLKQLARQLFTDQFQRLFIDQATTSINDAKAMSVVLSQSVYGENPAAIDYCRQQFEAHADSPQNISADIRAIVLSAVVKHDGSSIIDKLWREYITSQDADYKSDICAGITAARDSEQINWLLSLLTDTSLIRPQDNCYFVMYLMANECARSSTWQWIRHNWSWIEEIFRGDMGYDLYVQIAGNSLCTAGELAEYDQFFSGIDAPELARNIQLGHNNISNRVKWIERNKDILKTLLREEGR